MAPQWTKNGEIDYNMGVARRPNRPKRLPLRSTIIEPRKNTVHEGPFVQIP